MGQNSQHLLDFRIEVDNVYLELQSSHYAKEKAFISKCFQKTLDSQFDKVKLRLQLIDSLYSTQMSKRYYGIEELAEALAQYTDEELIREARNYVNSETSEILDKVFTEKYGYNSVGKKEKKAVHSFQNIYTFLQIINFQFMIAW